jgi:ADP-ribose pyrophosphatase
MVSPAVGVGAVIVRDGSVLLVRRGREPGRGLWSLPGGRLKCGERLKDAVEREVREETGLLVEAGDLAGVGEIITDGREGQAFHYVLLDFFCRIVGGQLRPGSDAADVAWHPLDALDELETTEGLPRKLREWLSRPGAGHLTGGPEG